MIIRACVNGKRTMYSSRILLCSSSEFRCWLWKSAGASQLSLWIRSTRTRIREALRYTILHYNIDVSFECHGWVRSSSRSLAPNGVTCLLIGGLLQRCLSILASQAVSASKEHMHIALCLSGQRPRFGTEALKWFIRQTDCVFPALAFTVSRYQVYQLLIVGKVSGTSDLKSSREDMCTGS